MDMVGGGPVTKAVFHVTRGPSSLPSFVHDVAWAFADFVNAQSYQYAATGSAELPLVAPDRRQGAAARPGLALHHGQRPRGLPGLVVPDSRAST